MSIIAATFQEVLAFLDHLGLIVLGLLKLGRRSIAGAYFAGARLGVILSSAGRQLWQLFYVSHFLGSQPGILNHLFPLSEMLFVGIFLRSEVALYRIEAFDLPVPELSADALLPVNVAHVTHVHVLNLPVFFFLLEEQGFFRVDSVFGLRTGYIAHGAPPFLRLEKVLSFIDGCAINATGQLHISTPLRLQ